MNERLRDLLRRGDPALGEPPLSPGELGLMRDRMAAAARAPARPARRPLAWAGAALACAVVAAAVWFVPRPREGAAPRTVPAPAATRPPAVAQIVPPPVPVLSEPPTPEPRAPAGAARRAPRAPAAPAVVAAVPQSSISRLEFVTPGGLRIYWQVQPDLDL
ncbi:MAG: hypothetical protein KBD01_18370 [Acidobacteria bacterium]|nr:hypothetical protein [Acidobacteriota bacterium]